MSKKKRINCKDGLKSKQEFLARSIRKELLDYNKRQTYYMALVISWCDFEELYGEIEEKEFENYVNIYFPELFSACKRLQLNIVDIVKENKNKKQKYYMQLVNIWVAFNENNSRNINKKKFEKYLEKKFPSLNLAFERLVIDIYDIVKYYPVDEYYVIPK